MDLSTYTRTTFERHQELILENMGIQKFDQTTKDLLISEAGNLCPKQTKPRLMFMSMMVFLRERKIEIPSYHTFSEVITDSLRNFEKVLVASLEENLSIGEKQLLESLLEFGDEYQDGDKERTLNNLNIFLAL
ncbi:MAG: DUF4158 domain-containing protein, partial [Thermodesulfobacteriota bacterium]|nr:DUF4158 domain-containing protein [Thermodesulfobacteriota bacterium]